MVNTGRGYTKKNSNRRIKILVILGLKCIFWRIPPAYRNWVRVRILRMEIICTNRTAAKWVEWLEMATDGLCR